MVNGRDAKEFFRTVQTQMRLLAPLKATGTEGAYDVFCTVDGGGPTGQSDAIVLGIARALKMTPATTTCSGPTASSRATAA